MIRILIEITFNRKPSNFVKMGHEGANRQVVEFGKPIDKSKLAEQTVLITGGASGMGAQMAVAFAQQKSATVLRRIDDLN